MKGVGLSQEILKKMSDKAQDHAIRLHYFVIKINELWFWERWFKTQEYKERVKNLENCLREVSQYLEYMEMQGQPAKQLKKIWDYALQAYERHEHLKV